MNRPKEELRAGVKEIKNMTSFLLKFLKFATLSESKLSDAASSVTQKILWGSIILMFGLSDETLASNIVEATSYGLLAYGIIDAVGVGIRWMGSD